MNVENKYIDFKIADNKMKVYADYVPTKDKYNDLSPETVKSLLESQGICVGIKHEAIKAICESENPMRSIIVAEGIAPKIGEKAKFKFYFDMNKQKEARKREDGSVDFHDLGEICSAEAGQDLFRRIPPTVGEPGKDLFGNEIPGILGKDLKIILGSETYFDKNDPNLVKSSSEGEIIIKNGSIHVFQMHTVFGDVDYSTGNVKFNGSLKINGSVLSGFKVEATGDIEVLGHVEDSILIGGNDVKIVGGYVGSGKGQIIAGRDAHIKFVENQYVEAKRDILIHGESLHAILRAGRSIITDGGKGIILGGDSVATISIEAKRLGSVAFVPTLIKVGIDPKIADDIKKIECEIKRTSESKVQLEASLVTLYRSKIDNFGHLPPPKNALLQQLEKAKEMIPDKLKLLESTLEKLIIERDTERQAFVTADVSVFPKVSINIGNKWMAINDSYGPSRFQVDAGELVRLEM